MGNTDSKSALDKYEVVKELPPARGGFGIVCKVRNKIDKKFYASKEGFKSHGIMSKKEKNYEEFEIRTG